MCTDSLLDRGPNASSLPTDTQAWPFAQSQQEDTPRDESCQKTSYA